MEKEYAVYEYNENASSNFIGTRFMSSTPTQEKGESVSTICTLIAKDLTQEDALALVEVKKDINLSAYLSSIPEEFRELTKQLLNGI